MIFFIKTPNRSCNWGSDDKEPARQRYECKDCGKHFDDLTGTIFAGHHQPIFEFVHNIGKRGKTLIHSMFEVLVLQILRAEHRQTTGERLPTAEVGFSENKAKESDSSYSGSLSISWEADLWQKLADKDRAAGKNVAEQQELFQSARDTLVAKVMKAWLGLIASQQAITIEKHRLATLLQNEHFILQRYRSGIGTLEDLDSTRCSIAS
jgi:hypothetical protein